MKLKQYPAELYDASVSRLVFSKAEAAAEYAKLRKTANRRLSRLEKAGYEQSSVFRKYGEGFASMRGASEAQLRANLGEVARFLSLKTSSVTGQRAATAAFVETMQERGYDFITKQNAGAFGRFMEAAKKHYGSKKAFDSEQIVDLFERALEAEADPEEIAEDFEYWAENMDKLKAPEMTEDDMEIEYIKRRNKAEEKQERRARKDAETRETSARQKREERRQRAERFQQKGIKRRRK